MKPARLFYFCVGSFVAPCPVLIRYIRDATGIHGRLHFFSKKCTKFGFAQVKKSTSGKILSKYIPLIGNINQIKHHMLYEIRKSELFPRFPRFFLTQLYPQAMFLTCSIFERPLASNFKCILMKLIRNRQDLAESAPPSFALCP